VKHRAIGAGPGALLSLLPARSHREHRQQQQSQDQYSEEKAPAGYSMPAVPKMRQEHFHKFITSSIRPFLIGRSARGYIHQTESTALETLHDRIDSISCRNVPYSANIKQNMLSLAFRTCDHDGY
jgi:hypothetical protein